MASVKQQAKSKTVQFNMIVPAVFGIAKVLGYDVPAEVVGGVLALGNYVLRFFTHESLDAK